MPAAIVPLSDVVSEVSLAMAVICDMLEPVPVNRKSPTPKNVVNEVPVPVTVVPVRAMVPAPAMAVPDENVIAALLIILSLPMSPGGILVTVEDAWTAPLKTKTSFVAGVVRVGVQFVAVVQAAEAL